jgi:ribose 5-phosphate isomerase A
LNDDLKRKAAEAALAEMRPGMTIGLGSGTTARHFITLLGKMVADGFECVGVPTSRATATLAQQVGVPLTSLDERPSLDLVVDGIDEIDPAMDLIKGGGGALLREKIVAAASARMVVIGDASKKVATLGAFPLPIEVDPFGLGYVRGAIAAIMRAYGAGDEIRLRENPSGEPFTSDGGHALLDAFFGRISDSQAVAAALDAVPGVLEHGLFVRLCDAAYIAAESGVEFITADQAEVGKPN